MEQYRDHASDQAGLQQARQSWVGWSRYDDGMAEFQPALAQPVEGFGDISGSGSPVQRKLWSCGVLRIRSATDS